MAVLDERCLHWPWRRSKASPAPVLARWELRALELLVLTPYFFGALAKLNRSWLLDAQPVRSWADEMLGELDALSHGRLGHMADAYRATMRHALRGATRIWMTSSSCGTLHSPSPMQVSFSTLACPSPYLPARCVPVPLPRSRASSSICATSFGLGLAYSRGSIWWPSSPCLLPRQTLSIARRPPPSGARRAAGAPPCALPRGATRLIPLRHLAFFQGGRSSLWTDEGHLYAWHETCRAHRLACAACPRVARRAQDTLGGGRQWNSFRRRTPRCIQTKRVSSLTTRRCSSPTLHSCATRSRCGASAMSPSTHLVRAYRPTAVPPAPLLPEANLLDHLAPYTSVLNDLTGYSGVGRFLHPWQPRGSTPSCELRTPPPLEIQRQSDEAFRWLYRPAFFSRPRKRDWPFEARARREGGGMSRSRLPWPAPSSCSASDAPTDVTTTLRGEGDEAAPDWARACSFGHAAGLQGGVWCPLDAEQAVQ